MRRIFNYENIVGMGLFIFAIILSTINFSTLQRMSTSYNKIVDFNTLRDMVFELTIITQTVLISILLFIVALIFIILGMIRAHD